MNISEIPPQELFDPSWLPTYEKSIDALWWQFVRLNSSLLVLGRVLYFPLDLFEPNSHHFWRLVEHALLESCVMIIWRTTVDTHPDVLTLNKLKNKIMTQVKPEHITQLRSALKQLAVERAIMSFEPRIRDIRMNYIAHLNLNRHVRPTAEVLKEAREILDELKRYTKVINIYFEFPCFGQGRALLPWGYVSEPEDSLDIDIILSRIARDSPILNAPENNPGLWTGIRQSLSHEELDALNHYRRKFSLPEI